VSRSISPPPQSGRRLTTCSKPIAAPSISMSEDLTNLKRDKTRRRGKNFRKAAAPWTDRRVIAPTVPPPAVLERQRRTPLTQTTRQKWCSGGPDHHWIQIELPTVQQITDVTIRHAGSVSARTEDADHPEWNTYAFDLRFKPDGSYTPIAASTSPLDNTCSIAYHNLAGGVLARGLILEIRSLPIQAQITPRASMRSKVLLITPGRASEHSTQTAPP
jgi:hypothetical protein